jgi:hypothetical protein
MANFWGASQSESSQIEANRTETIAWKKIRLTSDPIHICCHIFFSQFFHFFAQALDFHERTIARGALNYLDNTILVTLACRNHYFRQDFTKKTGDASFFHHDPRTHTCTAD